MKVVLSWLRELVPIETEPAELAERLSVSGFAVEEMLHLGAGISGVVIGEVRDVREHPNADSLVLVKAFDGSAERDIVCGARNFKVGDRVPVAVPGAKLPGGIEIGQRRVRGETSDGMLCSARELELADDHSGIMVLDPDAPLGADLVSALDLDDWVLHLDVTTNRGDCLSMLGIAREIAALYELPLRDAVALTPETAEAQAATVTIDDPKGCPRYLARVIEDVRVGPSPWWMRRRIMAAGMRPISNVVDVTNYVLLERGHPLHAFDLDRLAGASIIVRRARRGERLRTLDGVERALERQDVLICDAERPVAVAGVMGGADAEVSDKTTRILLESAYFDPLRIRATGARLKLRTEASVRFERGADPEGVPAAATRAAGLLAELAGGRIRAGAVDVYPKPVRRRPIRLRHKRTAGLLGVTIEAPVIEGYLGALGCSVESGRGATRATPPTWRPDLTIEEDLIEEVARIYGFDRIPETLPAGVRTGGVSRAQALRARGRDALLGAGLSEAQTQSLLPPWIPDRLGLPADHPMRAARRVANPMSEEESVLRPSLVPGLLLAAQGNVARRVVPVLLFETGVVFSPDGEQGLTEHGSIAFVMTGPAPEGWHGAGRPLDFFDAKGVAEQLLDAFGVQGWRAEAPGGQVDGALHPTRSAGLLLDGRRLGYVAELHPDAADAMEIPFRVAVGAFDLAELVDAAVDQRVAVPPRLPALTRDVAVVVPDDVRSVAVTEVIRAAAGALLESAVPFDVYRGDQVGEGRSSIAFSLSFRDPERTLTDADADTMMGAIGRAVLAAGWSIRE